jgi:hypothetical protein
MPRNSSADVIAQELHRVLRQFEQIETQVAALTNDRKRIAAVAHRLVQILRSTAGSRAARLLDELGLAALVAKLPGVPGRKPSEPVAAAVRKAPARKVAARKAPAAKKVNAKKAPPSAGRPEVLPKGTAVRLLSGKYMGQSGTIGYTQVRDLTVTYTVYLPESKSRTQVNKGSKDRTWEVVAAADLAAPAPARRAPRAEIETPSELVPKGTEIRMLTGIYLGYNGRVASVQVTKTGPRPDAIYMLSLVGAAGQKARTSVKQSSLGRVWTTKEG